MSPGTVALTAVGQKPAHSSHFACNPGFNQDAMAASDHAHDLEALDRGVSGLHRLEAPGGTDQPFERTMISLDPVVEVLRRPVPNGVFSARPLVSAGAGPSDRNQACRW